MRAPYFENPTLILSLSKDEVDQERHRVAERPVPGPQPSPFDKLRVRGEIGLRVRGDFFD